MAANTRDTAHDGARDGLARVVGIGASAGGLEAVRAVLAALPANTGMAFLVVQHLDPDHKSLLVSLLERATTMPTVRVEEGMRVEPDHVYVIPEQADVTVKGRVFHLQPRPTSPAGHQPFNVFLASLAKDFKARSVGVVLSGSDRDGTVGMAAVKAAGGLVFAQDPKTAQYDSMPQHVIDAGLADAVLSPDDIAKRLAGLASEPPGRKLAPVPNEQPAPASEEPARRPLLELADELLGENDKPGVIIDSGMQVQAFRGDVERFLGIPAGPLTFDLTRMVPPDVAIELRRIVAEALVQSEPVGKVVELPVSGSAVEVSLDVIPMHGEAEGDLLVVFNELGGQSPPAASASQGRDGIASKHEMAALRLHLQDALEEKDAIKEELQSSVEEAQSVNEELQTAKEELQSTNEELVTVNDELQDRNTELVALNSDLTSLLTSVDLPIVVLGKNLEIRRFTPAASTVLSVIPGDVGRPITDLRLKIDVADLPAALRGVLKSGRPYEQEARDEAGHHYLMRLRAFRAEGDEVSGVVISLADIEDAKVASQSLEDTIEFVSAVFDTVREPLVVLDSELRVSQANASFYRFFHVRKAATEGKRLTELGAGQWDLEALTTLLEGVASKGAVFQDFAVSYRFPKIGQRTLLLNARRVIRPHLGGEFILLAMEELPDRQGDPTEARRGDGA